MKGASATKDSIKDRKGKEGWGEGREGKKGREEKERIEGRERREGRKEEGRKKEARKAKQKHTPGTIRRDLTNKEVFPHK